MSESSIQCPNCSHEFPLTQSLAGPMLRAERQRHAAELAKLRNDQQTERQKLDEEKQSIEKQRQSLGEQVQKQVSEQLENERKSIREKETQRLAAENELKNQEIVQELSFLKQQLDQRNAKLAEAQSAQVELLKKAQELDDAKQEMALNIQKQVSVQVTQAKAVALHEAEQKAQLVLSEKNEQLAGLQRQIDELKRRSEQGSQQMQGEALEVLLEDSLSKAFARDVIDPVPKGVSGADLIQRVVLDNGSAAGVILWESKRTKAWSPSWLSKLREDQRKINADISILVSEALPPAVTSFGLIDNVWVTSPRYAINLAQVIRSGLINVTLARKVSDGQESKMELVYHYLTGPGFRTRVEAIVERFTELSEELDKEKRFMTKKWAKQEKQLEAVRTATLGLHGDLQGIAGAHAIPELESMQTLMMED